MRTDDLTPEQLEEAKAFQTPEEMLAYARDNGIDLTDEEMDAIAGGGFWTTYSKQCPLCGSNNIGKFKGQWYCIECNETFDRPIEKRVD